MKASDSSHRSYSETCQHPNNRVRMFLPDSKTSMLEVVTIGKEQISKVNILMLTIGIVYLWFGGMKFFHNVSPAEVLAQDTIYQMTFRLISPDVSIIILAVLETIIGIGLIFHFQPRVILRFALFHMACTFTPLFFFPEMIFGDALLSLTLVGQYIIKNIIIVGVLWTLLKNLNRS